MSLGDVLRSTVILHALKEHSVSWLTHSAAFLLLDGIPAIKVLHQDLSTVAFDEYDLIINLERDETILRAIQLIPPHKIVGFRGMHGELCFHNSQEGVMLEEWLAQPAVLQKNWSEKLYLLLGREWKGENYLISKTRLNQSQENRFAIGLNWQVGVKWPTKSWPQENWKMLSTQLGSLHSVTWQEGFDDLSQYLNWINSVQVLVTHDSLGLHIACALDKQILALFGPTSSREIHLGQGIALSESERSAFACPPCYKAECHNIIHCMKSLSVDEVVGSLRSLLRGSNDQSSA
ncbi:MAG: glycosyltransferase family 9 protein [Bacteriovoracia bacterium]